MVKQIYKVLFVFLLGTNNMSSQISCPSPYVYMDGGPGGFIKFYDPSLPLSVTNPSSTNIPLFGSGLTLMPNINGGTLTPTFYTTSGGTYWWWNGANWVNTGNSTGSGAAVNLGGCNGAIYNLVGGSGQVWVYYGTGPGTLLTTITGFSGGGPYDIQTDCNCNFFILKTTNPQSLTMYNPSGVPTCSYSLINMPNATAGGGFAIIGNMIYVKNNLSNGFFIGTLSGSTVTFTQMPGFTNSPGDFAACPNCPTLPATASNSGSISCSNPTVNVFATTTITPVTFTWSGPGLVGVTNQSVGVVNLPGVYTCTVSSPGCPPTQSIVTTTVTGTPASIIPTITTSGSITCTNTTVVISVAPNTNTNSYTWTGPGIISGQSTPTITVNAPGVYSVAVSNTLNSCAGSGSVNIVDTQGPLTLTVNPINPVKCSADAPLGYTVTGATSYVWNPGTDVTQITPNTFSVNPSVTTTYTINGSSGACTGSIVTTVSVIPSPTVNISLTNGTLCAQPINGSPASINVSANGATSYTWGASSNVSFAGSGSGSPSPLVAAAPFIGVPTVATVSVTGANAMCSNSAAITITIIPNPTVVINPTSAAICYGSDFTFNASGANTFNWFPGTNLNTTSGPSVTANPTTTSVYSVIGGSLGCNSATESATLNIIPNPTIVINPAQPTVCAGGTVNLSVNGAATYSWIPANNLSSTTGAIVAASPSALQTYSVIGTLNTCTDMAVVTVSVINMPELIVSASKYAVCRGQNTKISVNGAESFTWSPTSGLSSSTGAFVNAAPLDNTTYTITGSNGICTGSASIGIQVVAPPELSVSSPNFQVCEGGSTQITAMGAQSYSWVPSTGLNTTTGFNVVASPSVSTSYTVMGSNSSGTTICSHAVMYEVSVIPWAEAILPATATMCAGESVNIEVSGGNTYSWIPSEGLSQDNGPEVTASPGSSTTYSVISSFNGNCARSGTIEVIVKPLPIIYAGKDLIFNIEDEKYLKASSSGTLSWISGDGEYCIPCPETFLITTRGGTYVAETVNEFGCKARDEVFVEIIKDHGVYIPNTFTPNGDGLNDVFYVYGFNVTDLTMTIFDRWGEKLFTSTDQKVGWPGTYKGEDVEIGVYVYKVDYKGIDGKVYTKTGHVTVHK